MVIFLSYIAGISPPTPIFRGVTKRFKQECGPRASWQRDTSSSSSSSSDEDESVKPLWVQCDHRSCQKWRKVPPGTKIDMEEWVWIPVLPSFTCTLTLSLPLTHTHTQTGIGTVVCIQTPPTSHVTHHKRNARNQEREVSLSVGSQLDSSFGPDW